MAKQVQFRRGTTTQHSSFTGVAGEITIDTDKNTVVVHNGSTVGGIPLAKETVGTTASAAFDKANSANVLAYGTGIGANAYATSVGTSVNAYSSATYSTTTVTTAAFNKANSALQNTTGTIAGTLTSTGSFVDSKGDVRDLPLNNQIVAYVLTISDAGKLVSTNSNITIPSSIFFAGNTISVFNNSAANITISNASSVVVYQAGVSNTGSFTLTQRGLSTIICVATNTFVIAGAGLV